MVYLARENKNRTELEMKAASRGVYIPALRSGSVYKHKSSVSTSSSPSSSSSFDIGVRRLSGREHRRMGLLEAICSIKYPKATENLRKYDAIDVIHGVLCRLGVVLLGGPLRYARIALCQYPSFRESGNSDQRE